jgi:hypothetical protein
MNVLEFIKDQSIMNLLQTIKSDYFIVASLVAPGVLWLVKKFTGWTPWTSDDDLAEKIAKKIGIGQ